jgi:LmbE family N-acetylglucosaminyl deacetylase
MNNVVNSPNRAPIDCSMSPIELALTNDGRKEILCLGAHCDDIEIGCGATLLKLARKFQHVNFRWQIFTNEPGRGQETANAARQLLGADRVDVEVLDFAPSFLPANWEAVKRAMAELRRRSDPVLVFTHRMEDRHQDHRLIAELTWNSFRDHLILEYEIAKFEGDLGHPNLYVPLQAHDVDRKVEILMREFPSQSSKPWFDEDLFRGLMRVRGVECNAAERFAEAFTARKIVLG